MSKTPETNAASWTIQDGAYKGGEVVNSNFTRTLETQRDEARAEVEKLSKSLRRLAAIASSGSINHAVVERVVAQTFGEPDPYPSSIIGRYGDVFKALAENEAAERTQPEIFEAHGREWYRHTPGDKMPCDGEMKVCVLWPSDDDESCEIDALAQTFNWDIKELRDEEIKGWRPADAPEKLPRK